MGDHPPTNYPAVQGLDLCLHDTVPHNIISHIIL